MTAREARVLCLRLAAASGGGVGYYMEQPLDELVEWAGAAEEAFPKSG